MVKVNTAVAVLLVISLAACKQSTKAESSSKKVAMAKPVSVKHKDSLNAAQPIVNYFPADNGKYPLEILTAQLFHDGEVEPKLAKHRWKGLFKTGESYYIADTKLRILRAHDDLMDDTGSNSGLEVKPGIKDTSILLISGLDELKNGNVNSIALTKNQLLPGEQESLVYNDIKYTLYATGIKKSESSNSDFYSVSNYKLFLKAMINGKQYNQLLVSAPTFDDTLTSIIFAGDIDNDGIIDFIIDTTTEYNSEVPTLYLSKPATGSDKLLKVMGMHGSIGC